MERAEDIDEAALMRDAYLAERNRSMRDRGRQIGGVPGAMVAGLMIALRDIYETPKRDNGSVVVDSPSEPHDVDVDGVELDADDIGADVDVMIAAQTRRPPIIGRARRRSPRGESGDSSCSPPRRRPPPETRHHRTHRTHRSRKREAARDDTGGPYTYNHTYRLQEAGHEQKTHHFDRRLGV